MKYCKKNYLNLIFTAVSILLMSNYLTFVFNVYTLNALPKIAFFICFCVIATLLVWIKGKICSETSYKISIISFFFATVLFFSFYSHLIPNWESQQVVLRANMSEEYPIGEVWLVDAKIDGHTVEPSKLKILSINNWEFVGDYNDYVYYPNENVVDNSLSFSTSGENVVLRFASNPWSGSVSIESADKTDIVVLKNEEASSEELIYSIKNVINRSITEQLLLGVGVLILFSFFIITLLSLISRKIQLCSVVASIAYVLASIFLFGTSTLIEPSIWTKVMLFCMTAGIIYLGITGNRSLMEKYRRKGARTGIGFIAVYASLASFGYRFFLYGDTRPVFSASGVLYCIVGVIWFLPLIHTMLYLLELLQTKRISSERTLHEKRRAFVILFTVLCLCQSVALIAFWPGAFPPDCIDQIGQVLGIFTLNDWHPVIHTMFFRIVLSVFHNIGAITAVQMFFFVLLITCVLMEAYERGTCILPLCLGGGLFLLLPNQVISSILAEKDFPYTLSLLWGTWLVYRLWNSNDRKEFYFSFGLAINLFLVCTLRHNGIVPFITMALLYLIRAYLKKGERIRLLTAVLASLVLLVCYKGPLFHMLRVEKNEMSGYTVMLCAVGSCINKDLPLSDETNEIMAKVMPLDDWKSFYGRFVGHDNYKWGGGSGMNLSNISGKDVFSVYFDALIHYPDVVIKDRLDGTNILWDVTQPKDGFNYRAIDSIYSYSNREMESFFNVNNLTKEGTDYFNRSEIAELYRNSFATKPNQTLDMLLWRSGAYLILLWVLILYWIANRRRDMIPCSVPLLGNLAGLLLVLYYQSFRYIYAVQILVITLLLLTIITPGNEFPERMDRNRNG